MLKKILLGLVLVLVALCAFIATRPSTFHVQRSATIQAPADIVFEQVNDFHRWAAWSPWQKMDPNQKTTFEGPSAGVGARYGWSGGEQVGEGRMLIEESKANELVRVQLEFIPSFPALHITTFLFSTVAEGTQVTWKMEGTRDFLIKAFCLFMDLETMVGKDFEAGLAAMRQVAEAEAQKRAQANTEPTP